jgi:pyruvate-formate lyase-activating enzyme
MYDFISVSFIDYTCKIVATVSVSGCNLRYPYCHNSFLISVKEGIYQRYMDYRNTNIMIMFLIKSYAVLSHVKQNFGEKLKKYL